MNTSHTILWADDEIDLLKPHIMFLRTKGYNVETVNNGTDALAIVDTKPVSLVILDENMPGITGLETLQRIKKSHPALPVIMITKSEEENIMDQAVGSKIADYLIKPVNPHQILLSIKKNLHSDELVSAKSLSGYREQFSQISTLINQAATITEWMDVYRTLTHWALELDSSENTMAQMLDMQRIEANSAFSKFVRRNYSDWIAAESDSDNRPLLSPDLMKHKVFPLIDQGHKVWVVLIDNFRFDQWRTIRPMLADIFTDDDGMYCSILPTATQYARNAIFSGLMPAQIEKMFPQLWIDEEAEHSKNINEAPLIQTQLQRHRRNHTFSYTKINDTASGERVLQQFDKLASNDINVLVLNFIDMLSHARTESRMIRELASTNAAYRSLTLSWFRHTSVVEIMRRIAHSGAHILLTTDHGSIRVDHPLKVQGERNTNTNLRYKLGRNLRYNPREVYEITRPQAFGLPAPNLSTSYIFACGRDFFAYPNNYNHYVQYYDGTFQHGGISLEEMLIPAVALTPR